MPDTLDNSAAIEAAVQAIAAVDGGATPPEPAPEPTADTPPLDAALAPDATPDAAAPPEPEPAAPEPEPPPAATEPELSPAMLQLMSRERDLYQREQEVKAALKQADEAKGMLELARSDPVAFANQHLPQDFYETWTQRILNGGKETSPEQQKRLEARVAATEQMVRQQEEAQRAKEERQRVDGYLDSVVELFDTDESYEMCKTFPGIRDVAENVLNAQFRATGKVLTPAEIATTLRDSIVNDLFAKLSQTKVARSIWEKHNAAAPPAPAAPKAKSPGTAAPKTLSNSLEGSIEQAIPADLSFEEKLVRASKVLVMPGDG